MLVSILVYHFSSVVELLDKGRSTTVAGEKYTRTKPQSKNKKQDTKSKGTQNVNVISQTLCFWFKNNSRQFHFQLQMVLHMAYFPRHSVLISIILSADEGPVTPVGITSMSRTIEMQAEMVNKLLAKLQKSSPSKAGDKSDSVVVDS